MNEIVEMAYALFAKNFVDFIVYVAIAFTFLVGVFKCIFPLNKSAGYLRRAIRTLDKMQKKDNARPVWQNELFMGKKMQSTWRRFLYAAKERQTRGVSCDVCDYINDDSAIYAFGNYSLSEVVPTLLTSLGILGTFIGLMRGLGGLDISDASKTMESIPVMIGGMSFAFSTSIAGIGCSIFYNVFFRIAQGKAMKALDEFQSVFSQLVMEYPLDEETYAICQREDQVAYLRNTLSGVAGQVADRVSEAVERSFVPITNAMHHFIMGQTQSQMEGIAHISRQFIDHMTGSLSDQFLQLGNALSQINRTAQESQRQYVQATAATENILKELSTTQRVTEGIIGRFENYIQVLNKGRQHEETFVMQANEVLQSLTHSALEQKKQLENLYIVQEDVVNSINEYANRSKQTMQTICDRSDYVNRMAQGTSRDLQESTKELRASYVDFAQNISAGMQNTLKEFDNSMQKMLFTFGQVQISTANGNGDVIGALSDLEQTLRGIELLLKQTQSGKE